MRNSNMLLYTRLSVPTSRWRGMEVKCDTLMSVILGVEAPKLLRLQAAGLACRGQREAAISEDEKEVKGSGRPGLV